jgi:hypothetical protein
MLPVQIHLCWREIVERLMQSLLIIKGEVRPQIADRFAHALVIFEVNLSEGIAPSARLQNRT